MALPAHNLELAGLVHDIYFSVGGREHLIGSGRNGRSGITKEIKRENAEQDPHAQQHGNCDGKKKRGYD